MALGSIDGVSWGQKPVGSEDVVSPVEMGLHGELCVLRSYRGRLLARISYNTRK